MSIEEANEKYRAEFLEALAIDCEHMGDPNSMKEKFGKEAAAAIRSIVDRTKNVAEVTRVSEITTLLERVNAGQDSVIRLLSSIATVQAHVNCLCAVGAEKALEAAMIELMKASPEERNSARLLWNKIVEALPGLNPLHLEHPETQDGL